MIILVSASRRPAEDKAQPELPFPYQVIDEFSVTPLSTTIWKVRVFMLPEHYSKVNLDRLFRFYSMKYPNRQDMLQIFVYTDMKNLKREKENSDGLIHVFVDPRSNSNQASPD